MQTIERPAARRVRLRLDLHPGQHEVHESKARFRVVACGRQWGKSKYASAWAFSKMLEGKRGWWVAPTADLALIGWEMLRALADQIPGVRVNETYRIIELPNGGWGQVKGAHLPGKLRARTLDWLVGDEWAFVNDGGRRWNSELRPTLAIKQGEALFVSTFDGENHFYDLYELGQSDDPEWESWRKPSTENPYFPPREIELARASKTPEAEIQQEYFANPLVYVGAVFPGEKVQVSIDNGVHPEPWPSVECFGCVDWGHIMTAWEVCEEHPTTDAVRWIDEGAWALMPLGPDPERTAPTKIDLIVDDVQKYGIREIMADAAGATEIMALGAELDRKGLDCGLVGVPFGTYKEDAIKVRRWYLENGLEAMTDRVPELKRTSKRYHYKEGTEDIVKEDDHPVDAATAFYASRRQRIVEDR